MIYDEECISDRRAIRQKKRTEKAAAPSKDGREGGSLPLVVCAIQRARVAT